MSVTNFQDLNKLKAGSRLPIDINDLTTNTINFTSYIDGTNGVSSRQDIEMASRKYFSYFNKVLPQQPQQQQQKLVNRVSLLSINSTGSSSQSSSTSDLDSCRSDDDDVRSMKSACHKILSRQQLKQQQQQQRKILTILFDYDKFVKKGDLVYLLESNLNSKYLVKKLRDGQIGYIPNDCAIDLNDVKRKFKMNLKIKTNVKLTQL